MQSRVSPTVAVILVIVAVIAVGLALWWYFSAQPGTVPESVYPQAQTGQPTVEEVGPPPDVVPAGVPSAPPPLKGR